MSTRDKLLEAFDGEAGQVLSGERLARQLGLSRAAVWKQMQVLKSAGLPISSTDRQGYRLEAPFDNSLVCFRAPGWTTTHYFLQTASTQTLAKAGASAGLPEGHFWMAETQSKGRGRLERLWESGYGGLWFSLLLRPKVPAARVPCMALVAGLALRDAVEKVCGIKAKLKWPNDVVVAANGKRFKKLAGILTEMSGQMERTDWVVVGVGLNVNNRISKALSTLAASLYGITHRIGDRGRLLEQFLKTFHAAYERYQKEGFESFRRAYWSHYFAPGKTIRLKTAQGAMSGQARGIDAFGALMVESRRKILAISEGEIIR